MLIGLEQPTTGHIWVDGDDIALLDEFEMNRVRQKFGMVFQYAALLDSLTVFENVAFPLREHRKKMGKKEIQDKVVGMLNLLGLDKKEDRMPPSCRAAKRKRVGLARALMLDPQILIYDEPTSGPRPAHEPMVDDLIEETRRPVQRDQHRHLARHGLDVPDRPPGVPGRAGRGDRPREARRSRERRERDGAELHRRLGDRDGEGLAVTDEKKPYAAP